MAVKEYIRPGKAEASEALGMCFEGSAGNKDVSKGCVFSGHPIMLLLYLGLSGTHKHARSRGNIIVYMHMENKSFLQGYGHRGGTDICKQCHMIVRQRG